MLITYLNCGLPRRDFRAVSRKTLEDVLTDDAVRWTCTGYSLCYLPVTNNGRD